MTGEVEFCLLGPAVVRCGGVTVPIALGGQRAVLAALLLSAGQVVSLAKLTEVLWGDDPPPSARAAAQNHVMRLRQALGEHGRRRIITRPGGYLIQTAAGEFDVGRFEALLTAAQVAAGDESWEEAWARAGAALALWRGEPLADTGSEVLVLQERPRLVELRLRALEVRIDAELQLGDQSGVIGQLQRLIAEHPLRERLHGLLMLALYRDGRQGEALAAYQHARQVLLGELGVEPGAGLRELQRQILNADPGLALPGQNRRAGSGRAALVPRQLPGGVPHFTGRAGELAMLTRLVDQAGEERPGTVMISAIDGTAGVGKTALAVHWAHQVAPDFPDGQLYVNLRGYHPDQPMTAADALAGFLRALGVPGQDIPAELEERAARYRSLLAGRRMLVVLDNARSEDQVRPLLPGEPTCITLVTSRGSLPGLVARDGAARLDLGLLPLADAIELLRALIGRRAGDDLRASAMLADQCCRLPLALRIAAEFAASHLSDSLASLVAELADQQQRLDLLDAGNDPATALRAVFSWSYRHLDTDAGRVFRLIGLNPGPDLDAYAAAALTGSTSAAEARQLLNQLARAHLIHLVGSGQYGMHDLLRAYATGLATAQDCQDEGRAALTRLFDHYLHTAAAAMDTLVPAERHRRPRIPQPTSPAPPVADPATARTWLDAHRASLVAAAAHAADHGWPDHATRLASTLSRYLDRGAYFAEAITIHGCARRAARAVGDQTAEAEALTSLGMIDWRQRRYPSATRHLRQALALYRQVDDRTGQARALGNLGIVGFHQGFYQQAISHHEQALALFRELGDRIGEAHALGNLGEADLHQGHYLRAARYCRQALLLYRQTGDRTGEAYTLASLGDVELRRGRYEQATRHLRQALAIFRQTGDRSSQAYTLASLGDVELRQGRHEQATRHQENARTLFDEIGDQSGTAQALNGLGEALLAVGHPGDARARHTIALTLASQIDDPRQQARAHHGLGHACVSAGESAQARLHWQQALNLYTGLDPLQAEQVRTSLEHLDPPT